jgi:hypothetical protein
MKNIVIGRAINGITLNGIEYLLNPDGTFMEFDCVTTATNFIQANTDCPAMLIHECFNFYEIQASGELKLL